MIYLIMVLLAVALIAGLVWFLTNLPPASIISLARGGVVVLVLGLGIFLLLTGRVALDLPLAVLLYFLRGGGSIPGIGLFNRLRNRFTGAKPASSAIETPWLRMALDRETGALDGEVRAGRFAGAPLAQLSIDQLLAICASF
jgi:hypothetical protein